MVQMLLNWYRFWNHFMRRKCCLNSRFKHFNTAPLWHLITVNVMFTEQIKDSWLEAKTLRSESSQPSSRTKPLLYSGVNINSLTALYCIVINWFIQHQDLNRIRVHVDMWNIHMEMMLTGPSTVHQCRQTELNGEEIRQRLGETIDDAMGSTVYWCKSTQSETKNQRERDWSVKLSLLSNPYILILLNFTTVCELISTPLTFVSYGTVVVFDKTSDVKVFDKFTVFWHCTCVNMTNALLEVDQWQANCQWKLLLASSIDIHPH